MKSVIFIILSAFLSNAFGQNSVSDTLYILDEKPGISYDLAGRLHYLISIESKSSEFRRDGYKFILTNRKGFEEYYELKEIGQKVSLDSIKYSRMEELKEIPPCDLHNFFSLKKVIFLLSKAQKGLKRYRIIYEGTEKNIALLDHGF